MKIKSIYISAFGKFEDKTFDFSDGLNVIYGENEDGKTTLMNFIRMMFYGCSVRSSEALYKNPREKYRPRNEKAMAGSIDFEHGNRNYRIERIFKNSNSTDKIAVIDLDTNERTAFTGKEDLGKRFLGLSAEAADRSIFLKEHGAIGSNAVAEGEINSRLSNLATTGSEEISAQQLLSRLEKARNAISTKTGRGGKLIRDTERLNELETELQNAKRTEFERKECDLRIENEKAMLSSVNTEIGRLTAQIKAAEGGKRYIKLKEFVEGENALNSLQSKLVANDGKEITLTLLSEAEGNLSEYKILSADLSLKEERYNKLKSEVDKLKEELNIEGKETSDEIAKQIKDKKAEQEKLSGTVSELKAKAEETLKKANDAAAQKPKIRPLFVLLCVIGIIICALSFILTPLKNILLIGGGVFTFISVILMLALRKKPEISADVLFEEEKKLREEIKKIEEEKENLNALINNLITKEAVQREREAAAGENFTKRVEEFSQSTKDLEKLKSRLREIEDFLLNLSAKTKDFSINGIEIILKSHKDNLNKKSSLVTKLEILCADLDNISVSDAQKELSAIPEGAISVGDPDDPNNRLIFKKKEAEELRQKIADDIAKSRNDFRFHTHPTLIEKEIEELKATIQKEKHFLWCVDVASLTLEDASAKVRSGFGTALSSRTGEIMSGITGGKYRDVNVSQNFDITVKETGNFEGFDWQSLSDGTIDQAYFALRLGVSEFLSRDGEKLPLILDDPFDRYDDIRANQAMEFLKEYSKDSQALLFTCHKTFTEKYPFITLK